MQPPYAHTNNPYLEQHYDQNVENSYIIFLDCNYLYGYALSEPLPTGNFRFLDPDEREEFNLRSKTTDDNMGYILEVELEYPTHLHDRHNDYPLAPEKVVVTHNKLSPYTQEISKKTGLCNTTKSEKLIPNLRNKTNYVVHYRNLLCYMKMNKQLTKIHKILQFDQSKWLKPYIDFNTAWTSPLENNRIHLDIRTVTTGPSNVELV